MLVDIAAQVGRTVAQVMIRWALQRGWIVIPKSANKRRIEENRQVFDFELSPDHMRAIAALDEDYRTAPGWDPSTVA